MKKIITLFFISIYVLTATEAHELLRLPVLIQHFINHKKEDKTITFLQFLKLHYENKNSEDYKDTRLPFKSHDDQASANQTLAVPPSFVEISINAFTNERQKSILYKEGSLVSSYLSLIWQPPKLC